MKWLGAVVSDAPGMGLDCFCFSCFCTETTKLKVEIGKPRPGEMKVICIMWRQEWLGGESRIQEEELWWEKTSEFVWERRLEGEEGHS